MSSNITDTYGHGTIVSGIVAAMTNNGVGVAGVAWQVGSGVCGGVEWGGVEGGGECRALVGGCLGGAD